MTSFFYCLLRRIVSKVCLTTESDWESVHKFDSAGKAILGFMKKPHYWNFALRVAKATVEVERERERESGQKNIGEQTVTSVVLEELLNPFLESARNYLKFVCDGIPVHVTWKSDIVKGLACFDYAVIFHLQKEQVSACLGSLFKKLLSQGEWRRSSGQFTLRNICIFWTT